jgi:hypothetical protein
MLFQSNLALAALLLAAAADAMPKQASSTILASATRVAPPSGVATVVEFAGIPLPFPRGLNADACPLQKVPKWVADQKPQQEFAFFKSDGKPSVLPPVDAAVQPEIFANGLNALSFIPGDGTPPLGDPVQKVHCQLLASFKWTDAKAKPIMSTAVSFFPGRRYVLTFTASQLVTKAAIMMMQDISTRYIWDSTFPAVGDQRPGSGPSGTIEFEVRKEVAFAFALQMDTERGTSGEMAIFSLG